MIMKKVLIATTTAVVVMRLGGSTKFDTWPGGGGIPESCSRNETGKLPTIAAVDALIDILIEGEVEPLSTAGIKIIGYQSSHRL